MSDLDHITRQEAFRLLRRGLVTPQEVATMAGKTRQAGRLWAAKFPGSRQTYLTALHARTVADRSRNLSTDGRKKQGAKSDPLEIALATEPESSGFDTESKEKPLVRKNVQEVT